MTSDFPVYIRILEREDIPNTQKWINDPEIGEIMGYLPMSLANQERWYESIHSDRSRFIYAICLKETDEHIGNVALGNVDYINKNAMFSIFIAKKGNRGKGIGTSATILILRFAFMRLNLHRVWLKTSPNFTEAIRMYESLGFTKEGVLRKHEFKSGQYGDKYIYGILAEEFFSNPRLSGQP